MRKPLRAHGFAQVRDGRRIAEKISKAHVLSLEHCWESLPRLRMEVSIRQHLEELLLGALVDTLADQVAFAVRSEEHTSELQSLRHLVCRLLLEKKKNK